MSSWRTTTTVSTGLNARRATGLTVTDSKGSYTWTESVARWSQEGRAAYEAEREALLLFFCFFGRCMVFQSGRKCLHGRDGDCFVISENSGFIYIAFCGAAVPCCAFSFFVNRACRVSKEEKTYPTWGTYVRTATASETKRMSRPSCIPLKHGGGTLGIIKSPVCSYDHKKTTFNH